MPIYTYEQRGRLWAVFRADNPAIVMGWGITEAQAQGLVALYTRSAERSSK